MMEIIISCSHDFIFGEQHECTVMLKNQGQGAEFHPQNSVRTFFFIWYGFGATVGGKSLIS